MPLESLPPFRFSNSSTQLRAPDFCFPPRVADAVFYIQQGNIKFNVVSELGKEAVVAILGPSQFFGEGCLNGHPLRIATARTVDECVITRLENHDRHGSQRTGVLRTVYVVFADSQQSD